MTFTIVKVQPELGEGHCVRCGGTVFRARSWKNPEKIITVDHRDGPFVLEEDDSGDILAKWIGPHAGYAFHFNSDWSCATDDDVDDANNV